jgi:hypothetical protein|tara:strand:- start:3133 stop:3444 length:312 start_codon:yes stop_codon:yes gene_type:complete
MVKKKQTSKQISFFDYISSTPFYFGILSGVGLFLGIQLVSKMFVNFFPILETYSNVFFLILYGIFFYYPTYIHLEHPRSNIFSVGFIFMSIFAVTTFIFQWIF